MISKSKYLKRIWVNLPKTEVTFLGIRPASEPRSWRRVQVAHGFPTYDYSALDQAWLMWAVAVGSVAGTFPFSWLYTRFGARWVFAGAGALSAAATALLPLAASLSLRVFIGLRFVQVSSLEAQLRGNIDEFKF